jgi:hypothetical protein
MTGASVNVQHNVTGSVGATTVTGVMGAGGPTLTVKAGGEISVRTP